MATILVVEDKQPIRELLEATLTPEYQVVQAADATQAIELARGLRPDLMLLDVNLSHHREGLEVCQILRRDPDPVLAKMPVLILSGLANEADIAAGLAVGANGYVAKPFSPHRLLDLIATLLGTGDV